MSDSSLDAPRPPGGPQRDDAPAGPDSPGQPAPDPGPGTSRVTRPDDDGPRTHPSEADGSGQNGSGQEGSEQEGSEQAASEQDEARRALQEENAETSLDQPSQ